MKITGDLPHDNEEIDISIVEGEINEDSPGSTINPQVVLQVRYNLCCLIEWIGQNLHVASVAVRPNLTAESGSEWQ